jgi:DNA topoisomerase-6 subunit B
MPNVNETGKQQKRGVVTAESMAAKQRDISVSEFFAKNRHLLGFDNPRKALLTAVKEAVDNSLDACEEAGIVPEIWVHIEPTGSNRYKVGVQDNGPGIVKKQIPLIFGKLLYGSKFHRLRMSRGQQGIGISAAGMYGMLTTGKPVKIVSMTSPKKPAHYFEIQIDTRRNMPEIINGKGDGEDIPAGEKGQKYITDHGIEWVSHYPIPDQQSHYHHVVRTGTRVTIEFEGRYQRGRGSVDEYLEQTAIANPHVTIHYVDPDGGETTYSHSTTQLPPEPVEIKPHPYGIELGQLVTMLKDTSAPSMAQFLTTSFSRVSSGVAQKICETAKISARANPKKIGRQEADSLYKYATPRRTAGAADQRRNVWYFCVPSRGRPAEEDRTEVRISFASCSPVDMRRPVWMNRLPRQHILSGSFRSTVRHRAVTLRWSAAPAVNRWPVSVHESEPAAHSLWQN